MFTHKRSRFLFYTLTLFFCFGVSFFLSSAAAQDNAEPDIARANAGYTFESIEVPEVEFLELTASSDFEGYAGNTHSADGQKIVGFTLIDGVFTTYDFPEAKNTYFYALGNDGTAAGHYEDSDGLFHGVILEEGELRQYDFPDAVQTFIYGYSDTTGELTGSFIDNAGIRRGFTGDMVIEIPGAIETYADFAIEGRLVGSYIDAEGIYHTFLRSPNGDTTSLDLPGSPTLQYFFLHGLNNVGVLVAQAKAVGDIPRTYVGPFYNLQELSVPGSVITEGWNINQDGSIVGNYETAEGRRLGFVAKPVAKTVTHVDLAYTYESIDVPGVDFLELTASSDFEDYAGNTRNVSDSKKIVGFTLFDGVFKTYDFPGAKNTYFYALGNNGVAAGHYEDSDGLFHGVILEDGELRHYDFPGSLETQIYGYSDATGVLTGNFTDASGVRRGFSGDTIVEFPGATATSADFVNASGTITGNYVDADGITRAYTRPPNGDFISADTLGMSSRVEYAFVHGISDAGHIIARSKAVGDIPRTYVNFPLDPDLVEVNFPGSVVTQGWNINQDGSVVGNYDSPDGRRHGFIARPTDPVSSEAFANAYTVLLSKGLNMLSVPLGPLIPMTAKSLTGIAGATVVITLDSALQDFVAWTPNSPNEGFRIEGGKGYIVNVPETRNFAFVGSRWTNQPEVAGAPASSTEVPQHAWAFVVSGHLAGKLTFDNYQVSVRNLRTNATFTTTVQGDYFAAATADLTRRSVVHVGDTLEVRVLSPEGNLESEMHRFKVTPEHLANAVLFITLDDIGQPQQSLLLQNYPNPFNPETWIPYQLSEDSPVSVSIYDPSGTLVRTLSLGHQGAGFYNSRERAAYWDGRNALGERVASGVYFYHLTTPTFQQTRRMLILK